MNSLATNCSYVLEMAILKQNCIGRRSRGPLFLTPMYLWCCAMPVRFGLNVPFLNVCDTRVLRSELQVHVYNQTKKTIKESTRTYLCFSCCSACVVPRRFPRRSVLKTHVLRNDLKLTSFYFLARSHSALTPLPPTFPTCQKWPCQNINALTIGGGVFCVRTPMYFWCCAMPVRFGVNLMCLSVCVCV